MQYQIKGHSQLLGSKPGRVVFSISVYKQSWRIMPQQLHVNCGHVHSSGKRDQKWNKHRHLHGSSHGQCANKPSNNDGRISHVTYRAGIAYQEVCLYHIKLEYTCMRFHTHKKPQQQDKNVFTEWFFWQFSHECLQTKSLAFSFSTSSGKIRWPPGAKSFRHQPAVALHPTEKSSHQRMIPTLTHALNQSIEINMFHPCEVKFFKVLPARIAHLELSFYQVDVIILQGVAMKAQHLTWAAIGKTPQPSKIGLKTSIGSSVCICNRGLPMEAISLGHPVKTRCFRHTKLKPFSALDPIWQGTNYTLLGWWFECGMGQTTTGLMPHCSRQLRSCPC